MLWYSDTIEGAIEDKPPAEHTHTLWERTVIEFHVDRTDSLPAYAQIAQQVREALRLGRLRPGDRLPTVRDVVVSCTVNANTVQKAYRELEHAGLVEARQGSGTYVSGTLGTVDPHDMRRLRTGLARWVAEARKAHLEDEDVRALVTAVLAEEPAAVERLASEAAQERGARS